MISIIYYNYSSKYDQFNKSYIYFKDFVYLLLRSIKKTNPQEEVFLLSINSDDNILKKFNRIFSNIHITRYENKNHEILEREEFSAIFRSYEFKFWKSLLEQRLDEVLLIVDNDVIVRDELGGLYGLMEFADVGFHFREAEHINSRFNKGVFALKGKGGITFLERWEKNTYLDYPTDRHDKWFLNQLSAYKTYKESHDLKFVDITSKYHDSDLTEDGIIWHTHKIPKIQGLKKYRKNVLKFML